VEKLREMVIVSKIKTNQTYRTVAKAMRGITKAKEVFIEAYYNGQEHRQMIEAPEPIYNSDTNCLGIITFSGYGDYCINLNELKEVDYINNGETFDCWLYFNKDTMIEISSEW
jgi:hypothetical protein